MATSVLSFRVEEDVINQLDHLARATERDRQYHLKRALAAYLSTEAWHLQAIAEGVADADAGQLSDLASVQAQWAARAKAARPD
ncbi:ribbon-helix-helix protein, CopG family [Pseudomonas sp. NPDC007930]|uniref:CopG family ribbon-helix-helix protein n=1 Tax=Pseudomonas sp. NPDC007930 TaxID=3364417 RepID=UPI0036E51C12